MISAEGLSDQDRIYKPVFDPNTGLRGIIIPRAADGCGGGSTGFNPAKLMPYTIISPELADGLVVDPNTLMAESQEAIKFPMEAPEPIIQPPVSPNINKPVEGSRKLLSQLGYSAKKIENKAEKTMSEVKTPDVPIKFTGSFGEIDTYYFEVSVQADMIVLSWDKSYRGSKYTPPTPRDGSAEPLNVIYNGTTYRVRNYNLKFDIVSANLEVLLLLIDRDEDSL